jgi:hypothetical protein
MRHRSTYRLVATLAASLCVLIGTAAPAQAISISPTKVDLSLTAGGSQVVRCTVTADAAPIDVTFRHIDFGLDANYKITLIEDGARDTTSFSTRGWFTIPEQVYHVKAGASVDIPVTVTVPMSTPGGTYLGIPLFVGTPKSDGGQIQLPTASGPELFINVAGGSKPKVKITRFEVPQLVQSGPIDPKLVVTNQGDGFFSVTGEMRVDGSTTGAAKISQQYVLPRQPRTLRRSSTTKQQAAANVLRVGTDQLGFGRHTVELRLRVTPTNATVIARRTFWVVPMWAWVVGGLALLLTIGALASLTVWLLGRRSVAADSAAQDPVSPVDAEAGQFDAALGIESDAARHGLGDIDSGLDPILDGIEFGDEEDIDVEDDGLEDEDAEDELDDGAPANHKRP